MGALGVRERTGGIVLRGGDLIGSFVEGRTLDACGIRRKKEYLTRRNTHVNVT